MSRHHITLLIVTSLLALSGCAIKQGPSVTDSEVRDTAQEESYIIHALYYKQHGEYAKAYALFDELYRKTHKEEYRLEAARMLIAAKRFDEARKILAAILAQKPDEAEALRLMAVTSLRLGEAERARAYAKKLLALDPDDLRNVDLLASIDLLENRNRQAYEAYEAYYRKHHDDGAVVKMASILYHKLKKPDEAIRLLESHSKMIGCSEELCLFLAELYRQKGDLDNLADTFERLYETTKSPEYAQKAAEIYAYKKEFDKAEALLRRSDADDRLLLAIYKHTKQFKKAAGVAKSLYEETSDPVWLAEYGILIYEAAPKKSDPKLLKEVVESLREAFKEGVGDPLYYNYLGYLLIDHDIDVKWGIELVKKALASEPDSAYYLDSLAWGYYKLHRCKEAYETMKRVVEIAGLKDKEIREHWDKIQHCRSVKP
ncbi:tetratricopeptide repeat protein [Hydrogenimonas sp.]